jgi:hemerythrin
MALVTWTAKMSVGHGKFDKQHQGLFDIINRLHEAMLSGHGKEALGKILGELAHYTRVHFADEETLLGKYFYEGLDEHVKQHDAFRTKVAELDAALKAGKAALSVAALNFLREWLAKHILGVDMQYREFLEERGGK